MGGNHSKHSSNNVLAGKKKEEERGAKERKREEKRAEDRKKEEKTGAEDRKKEEKRGAEDMKKQEKEGTEERTLEAARRAEERKMKVQRQREAIRSGGVPHISDLRIILLGSRGQGKTASGNTILDKTKFDHSALTIKCEKGEGETAGRHITVVDTPGWRKECPLKTTTERIKQEIILSLSLCPPGPHAVLVVIDMRSSCAFTETEKRALQEHVELLGERVWNHTMVLFTYGNWLDVREITIEQLIESGGEALQWVVEKCGNRYHVVENWLFLQYDNKLEELLEKIEEIVAENGGNHFGREML